MQFWRGFKELFQDKATLKTVLSGLKWNEIGSIIYTLAHVNLLTSSEEWEEVVALFLERSKKDFD